MELYYKCNHELGKFWYTSMNSIWWDLTIKYLEYIQGSNIYFQSYDATS